MTCNFQRSRDIQVISFRRHHKTIYRHCRRKTRNGFTLFEVIIAIGLGIVLLSALYTAIQLHWMRMQSGYQNVHEVAIARGLSNRITRDMDQAVFLAVASDQSEVAPAETEPSDSETEEELPSVERGLWGDGDWIVFDLGVPLTRHDDLSETDENDPSLMVFYGIDAETNEQSRHLVRKILSRDGFDTSDISADTILATIEPGDRLTDKVNEISFRYYDGIDWNEQWDSSLLISLPRAIEITLTVQPTASENVTHSYRRVFAFPTNAANRVFDDYQLQNEESS
jgi:type II secretory pathway component PulJ